MSTTAKSIRNIVPVESRSNRHDEAETEAVDAARKLTEEDKVENSLVTAAPTHADPPAVALPKLAINKPQFNRLNLIY